MSSEPNTYSDGISLQPHTRTAAAEPLGARSDSLAESCIYFRVAPLRKGAMKAKVFHATDDDLLGENRGERDTPGRASWNARLRTALQARIHMAIANHGQKATHAHKVLLQRALKAIREAEKDIWRTSSGLKTIYNLPAGLKDKILTMCSKIIEETEPVDPVGYDPRGTETTARPPRRRLRSSPA
jgi:hypothetical protein